MMELIPGWLIFFFWGGVVDTGNHTFQGKFGCELRNNTYCKAFWRYAYDRRDYIKFNTEIPAWIPLQKVALNTKVKWEKEGSVQAAKNYLEDECPQILQRYLQYSKNYLDRQGTHCSLCSILWHWAKNVKVIPGWELRGTTRTNPMFISLCHMSPGLSVGKRQEYKTSA